MIIEDTSIQVTIQSVRFSVILDAPNSADLIRAYATECLVPDSQPQPAIYAAMEKAGVLKCFAAYAGNVLVGFISILTAVMPHDGRLLATVESLFVSPDHRDTGAGNLLLDAAEEYARDSGCSKLAATARVGSAFDKVLTRRAGYKLTHSQHTRWLQ